MEMVRNIDLLPPLPVWRRQRWWSRGQLVHIEHFVSSLSVYLILPSLLPCLLTTPSLGLHRNRPACYLSLCIYILLSCTHTHAFFLLMSLLFSHTLTLLTSHFSPSHPSSLPCAFGCWRSWFLVLHTSSSLAW